MQIENISRGGLLLAWRAGSGAAPLPPVGQLITVEVELPVDHDFGPKCIHCQGAVARVSTADKDYPRVAVRLNYMDFRSMGGMPAIAPPPSAVHSWMT